MSSSIGHNIQVNAANQVVFDSFFDKIREPSKPKGFPACETTKLLLDASDPSTSRTKAILGWPWSKDLLLQDLDFRRC